MTGIASKTSDRTSDYDGAYPNSHRVYIGDGDVRVPMRQVSLSAGESSVLLYDTSGPRDVEPQKGLPPLRRDWVLDRSGVTEISRSGTLPVHQIVGLGKRLKFVIQ